MRSTDQKLARQQLEESWRLKCEQARQRYETARTGYRNRLKENPSSLRPAAEKPLLRARQAESDALADYFRVLRTFTDLIVHGRTPDECEAAAVERKETMTKTTLVSVVDDDQSIRDSTKLLLRSAGYRVETFWSCELFLESGSLRETECLILDIRMPGMDGLELQRRLNLSDSDVPVIFISAHFDATDRKRAIDAGASAFFQKPFQANDLLAAIETAVTIRPYAPGDRPWSG